MSHGRLDTANGLTRRVVLAIVIHLGRSRGDHLAATDAGSARAPSTIGSTGSHDEGVGEGPSDETDATPGAGMLVVKPVGARGAALTNAVVQLDGVDRCSGTPCRLSDVGAGRHVLSLVDTPASATRDVTIRGGHTLVVAAQLEPPTASIRVELPSHETLPIEPDHALTIEMELDGRRVGNLPACLSGLSPGTHSVSSTEVSAKRRQVLLQRRGLFLTANQTSVLHAPTAESDGWTISSVEEDGPLAACGTLSASDILDTKWRFLPMLKERCARRMPPAVERHDARIWVSFTLHPAGHVIGVAVDSPEPSHDDLAECVVEHARRWKFPRANGYSQISVAISLGR
jgi:hypothetical protein